MNLWELITAKLYKWYKGHEGKTDAHHTKYTDANAVSAVSTADDYVKNSESDTINGNFTATGTIETTSKGNFGDKCTSTLCSRALNLISTVALVKIARFSNWGSVGMELIQYDGDESLRSYWQFLVGARDSAGGALAGCFIFNDRTVGNEFRMVIDTNGNVGFGTTYPTCKCDVNDDNIRIETAKTPASAGASGNQGDICWDTSYIYVCTATNTWKRVAIANW